MGSASSSEGFYASGASGASFPRGRSSSGEEDQLEDLDAEKTGLYASSPPSTVTHPSAAEEAATPSQVILCGYRCVSLRWSNVFERHQLRPQRRVDQGLGSYRYGATRKRCLAPSHQAKASISFSSLPRAQSALVFLDAKPKGQVTRRVISSNLVSSSCLTLTSLATSSAAPPTSPSTVDPLPSPHRQPRVGTPPTTSLPTVAPAGVSTPTISPRIKREGSKGSASPRPVAAVPAIPARPSLHIPFRRRGASTTSPRPAGSGSGMDVVCCLVFLLFVTSVDIFSKDPRVLRLPPMQQ